MVKQQLLVMATLFILSGLFWTGCSEEQAVYQPAVAKLIEKADGYKKAGQPEQAICRLEAASDIAPDTFQVHYNLGIVYTDTSNWLKAVGHLEKSLEISKDHPSALFSLAYAYEAMGQEYWQASQAVDSGAADAPDASPLVKGLKPAEAQAKYQETIQKALAAYQQFLKAAPMTDPSRKDAEVQIDAIQQQLSSSP